MSRTKHHNAPKRPKLMKLPDRYTGWVGEGQTTQNGLHFLKRQEHRAQRRWGFKDTLVWVKDALFGKDVPLLFEREYVQEQPYVPAQPKLPATRWKRCSSTGLRPNFRSV